MMESRPDILLLVGKHIEPHLPQRRTDEHRILGLGLLEQRVGAGGHGDGDDALLLRLALVEAQVERTHVLVLAKDLDDAVRQGVDDLDAEHGAVQDEMARLVKDDVDACSVLRGLDLALDRHPSPELELLELLKRRPDLLHLGDGVQGLVVDAVQLAAAKVEDADHPIRKGVCREMRAVRGNADGDRDGFGLLGSVPH